MKEAGHALYEDSIVLWTLLTKYKLSNKIMKFESAGSRASTGPFWAWVAICDCTLTQLAKLGLHWAVTNRMFFITLLDKSNKKYNCILQHAVPAFYLSSSAIQSQKWIPAVFVGESTGLKLSSIKLQCGQQNNVWVACGASRTFAIFHGWVEAAPCRTNFSSAIITGFCQAPLEIMPSCLHSLGPWGFAVIARLVGSFKQENRKGS